MAKNKKHSDEGPEPDDEPRGLIIQIDDDWRMAYDGMQFLVQRSAVSLTGKHKGEQTWRTQAYCGTIDSAVFWFAARRIYAIKGKYGVEGLDLLGKTLDAVKALCASAIKQAQQEITEDGTV